MNSSTAPAEPETEITRQSPSPGSAAWWRERRAARDRRRHRPGGLTTEQITETALAIVDGEGLAALTMRRLADQLGTGAASLYRHVANREELLVEVVDHVLGSVEFGTPKPTWREDFRNQAHLLRAALIDHPHLLPVALRTPLLGPNAVRGREACLRRMLDYGFSPADVQPMYTVIVTTVLGQAVFAAQRATGERDRPEPLRPEVYRDLPADRYPTVTALADRTEPQTSSALFTLTIDIMLDGIEARYPRALE
ncbi:TetR/AcrR family transcriptional regulator [Cryptosporangium aurantiacum]|uniref:Transcriptional regulator, TetR family n=1 Tax=Cryptosporangium aurantiacum TaxID=134849 RepID=A0A1M7RMW8_9ACTN|nr:TetR/AcrR family transcriptional regulator [Cryptosporangium aurantiacum]SHN47594.1 transcriptional regulator, TetR family [Cryptosporangium aurantiacum]